MKFKPSLLSAGGVLFAAFMIAAPAAWSQTFTTFDPPGSAGTSPVSINPAGQIVGSYFDADFVTHGFLRATDGTITSFDAPGASYGTVPVAITAQGLIVGTYTDLNFTSHIFLRAKDGTFTTVEIPSPAGSFFYVVVANSAGGIAGGFVDANGIPSGFLRLPSGKFTLFELPPAFTPSFFLPNFTAVNAAGTILGSYFDSNLVLHGFLRTIDGTFTTFDVPNALADFPFQGTIPASINESGIVSGFYYDTTKNSELRVFLRAANGVFSSFATPQLGSFGGAASINPSGAVAGNVQNFVCTPDSCTNVLLSFLRSPSGTVIPVNNPHAVEGTTLVNAINSAGEIIGAYSDVNNVQHGFLRTP